MEIIYTNSYLRAIKKIKSKGLILNLGLTIDNIEKAESFKEILNVKKLSGFINYFRIRVDDYRIGFVLEGNILKLVQFQHRKDIYKKFP